MRKTIENKEFTYNGNLFYLILKQVKSDSFLIEILNKKGLVVTNNSPDKKNIQKSLVRVVNFKKAFTFSSLKEAIHSYANLTDKI